MTVDADLAILRHCIKTGRWSAFSEDNVPEGREYLAALDHVETELARLREERDALLVEKDGWHADVERQYLAAEAAEARCAQLEQALREIEELCAHWELHDKIDPDEHERWRKAAIARAKMVGDRVRDALAAHGTPADSQEDKT